MTDHVIMHPEVADILDPISDNDQQWFLDHPKEQVRLRPQFKDEYEALVTSVSVKGPALPQSIDIFNGENQQIPNTWMAIVDLFRLPTTGAPFTEGCRIKLPCPEPVNGAEPLLKAKAISMVTQFWKYTTSDSSNKTQKSKPRGFRKDS